MKNINLFSVTSLKCNRHILGKKHIRETDKLLFGNTLLFLKKPEGVTKSITL